MASGFGAASASDPTIIAEVLSKYASESEPLVFETCPLSIWFYHALTAEGVPAFCIDARHAKAALDMAPNKTDANDDEGLAHLAEVGFFREVRVKGYNSMLLRTLVAAPNKLVRMSTEHSNQIRGVMKTFCLIVPSARCGSFEAQVQLLSGDEGLTSLSFHCSNPGKRFGNRLRNSGARLLAGARQSQACRQLMAIPGSGAITATSFVTAVEVLATSSLHAALRPSSD